MFIVEFSVIRTSAGFWDNLNAAWMHAKKLLVKRIIKKSPRDQNNNKKYREVLTEAFLKAGDETFLHRCQSDYKR